MHRRRQWKGAANSNARKPTKEDEPRRVRKSIGKHKEGAANATAVTWNSGNISATVARVTFTDGGVPVLALIQSAPPPSPPPLRS